MLLTTYRICYLLLQSICMSQLHIAGSLPIAVDEFEQKDPLSNCAAPFGKLSAAKTHCACQPGFACSGSRCLHRKWGKSQGNAHLGTGFKLADCPSCTCAPVGVAKPMFESDGNTDTNEATSIAAQETNSDNNAEEIQVVKVDESERTDVDADMPEKAVDNDTDGGVDVVAENLGNTVDGSETHVQKTDGTAEEAPQGSEKKSDDINKVDDMETDDPKTDIANDIETAVRTGVDDGVVVDSSQALVQVDDTETAADAPEAVEIIADSSETVQEPTADNIDDTVKTIDDASSEDALIDGELHKDINVDSLVTVGTEGAEGATSNTEKESADDYGWYDNTGGETQEEAAHENVTKMDVNAPEEQNNQVTLENLTPNDEDGTAKDESSSASNDTGTVSSNVALTDLNGTKLRRGIVMSCPAGGVSHNPGSWKPAIAFTGVKAVAKQLVALGSKLELVVAIFENEMESTMPDCKRYQDRYEDTLSIHCINVGLKPEGYGVTKIIAVMKAPLDQIIWLDCDAFPVRDPEYLFEDAEFQKTGAMFWGDVEKHYHFERLPQMLERESVSPKNFPLDQWWTFSGFDSGTLVIEPAKVEPQLQKLSTMGKDFSNWEAYTTGDKELWHFAWMLLDTNYTLVPYVGAAGHFDDEDKWRMSSQLKFDRNKEVVFLHQLWRDHRQMTNFFNKFWTKLGPQARYNEPSITICVDLRVNANYTYNRAGHHEINDWNLMKNGFHPREMYPSDLILFHYTQKMAMLWEF
eukprot:m.270942 g.270942  ORF g.270942 m.270942 type:complete len:752 (+) comp16265_c1_seq72:1184-3439(+)